MNTAYRTLLSPMERIGYVLGRNGKEVGEGEQMEDMGLIAEVMEVREAIERSTGEELGQLKEANDGKSRNVRSWVVLSDVCREDGGGAGCDRGRGRGGGLDAGKDVGGATQVSAHRRRRDPAPGGECRIARPGPFFYFPVRACIGGCRRWLSAPRRSVRSPPPP